MKIRRFNEGVYDLDSENQNSCKEYLAEAIQVVNDGGGNSENMRVLEEVANHLDAYSESNQRSVGEPGWYGMETKTAFTDLVDSMAQDERANPSNDANS